jgi:hypothetical protein
MYAPTLLRSLAVVIASVGLAHAGPARRTAAKSARPARAPEPRDAPSEDAPRAPAAPPSDKTIAVDGGAALPVGSYGDVAGLAFGALGRFEMPLAAKLTLTARAGFLSHLGKDGPAGLGGGHASSISVLEIPLLGGVRYALSQGPASEVYGAAELGLIYARVSSEAGGMSSSGSDTNLGLTLGGGYRAGKLDVRGGLMFSNLGHLGDTMGLLVSVGYEVASL